MAKLCLNLIRILGQRLRDTVNLKQKRGKEYVIDKKTNMLENCKSFGQSQRDGRSADRQSKKISKIARNARQNYFKSKRHLSDCFLFCDFSPIDVEDIYI